jgi:hypothetical protein
MKTDINKSGLVLTLIMVLILASSCSNTMNAIKPSSTPTQIVPPTETMTVQPTATKTVLPSETQEPIKTITPTATVITVANRSEFCKLEDGTHVLIKGKFFLDYNTSHSFGEYVILFRTNASTSNEINKIPAHVKECPLNNKGNRNNCMLGLSDNYRWDDLGLVPYSEKQKSDVVFGAGHPVIVDGFVIKKKDTCELYVKKIIDAYAK